MADKIKTYDLFDYADDIKAYAHDCQAVGGLIYSYLLTAEETGISNSPAGAGVILERLLNGISHGLLSIAEDLTEASKESSTPPAQADSVPDRTREEA